jgi:O-antigen biosynthesis protein
MSDVEPNQPDDAPASNHELVMSARIARLKKELAQSKKEMRALLAWARRWSQVGRRAVHFGEKEAVTSPSTTVISPSSTGFVQSLFQPWSKASQPVTRSSATVEEMCPVALFDPEFYLTQAEELGLEGAQANPWASYVLEGERLGLNPHPLFKTQYYLQQLSWQMPAGQTLIAHYLEHGHEHDLRPHPLFVPRYYKEQLADADRDTAPLLHYLETGYLQGLKPSSVFDPSFYLSRYRDVQQAGVEPLCHYIRCGDAEGRQPNPHFDPSYYRQHCGLLADFESSLEHYLQWGRFEGRKPNRSFDEEFYANNNPDAIDFEGGAFAHYCQIGAGEGRRCMPEGISAVNPYDDEAFTVRIPAPFPQAPSEQEWQELNVGASAHRQSAPVTASTPPDSSVTASIPPGASVTASIPPDSSVTASTPSGAPVIAGTPSGASVTASIPSGAPVTVIIPIYRNMSLSLACIYSVLKAKNQTSYRLLVVDDHSPEPALSAELVRLAQLNLFTLMRNEINLGFVGTVNRGMAECQDGDVVLLNSDTVVFDGWLDRLAHASTTADKIGTVTPLSNNADICSYPAFCTDNNELLEVDFSQLDKIISVANAGMTAALPTAVGFCMLIKRACLDAVGAFDEVAFGKGYGEENDFCMRASALGWSHVLAADAFVRHMGSASFGIEKSEHMRHGAKIIAQRYPFYEKLIDDFCKQDPLMVVRRKIDLARALPAIWQRSILLFAHRDGGGVERHIRDLASRWESQGVRAIIVRPARKTALVCEIHCLDTGLLPNLSLDLADGWGSSEAFLQELKIGHIHIHHTASYGSKLWAWVEQVTQKATMPIDLTIHDYGPICPRLNFVDGSGIYCGEPDEAACQKCVDNNGTDYGRVDVNKWRHDSQRLLALMRTVIAPSNDVLGRYNKRFSNLHLLLKPHIENWPTAPATFPMQQKDEPLRVALIGSLGLHKGRDVLIACAQDAWRRKLPLEFVIIGVSHDETVLSKLPNVIITGPFEDNKVLEVIARQRCHVSFFASVCPETYSYTLSLAMAANLFPFAFDLGAIAERLRTAGWGKVLNLQWINEPGRINDEFLQTARVSLASLPESIYPSLIADYYELPPDFLQVSWQSLYTSPETSATAASQEQISSRL